MATRREPRFKLCRRLGVNVCGHPKAMKRVDDKPSKGGKKISEYGLQLLEKQKIKAYYGILERQLARYMKLSQMSSEITGEALLKALECRLDNLVYRLGFARSIRQARQIVTHGHILLNGKKVNIPSQAVKESDVISLCEQSRKNPVLANNFQELHPFGLSYLEKNPDQYSGKLVRFPLREEIPVDVNEILVIEHYSQ